MLQKNSLISTHRATNSEKSDSVADAAMELVQLTVGIIRRQWMLILAATTASFVIATIYLMVTPPVFSARAILIIDAKKEPSFQQQQIQFESPVDTALVSSQVEILKSDNIASAVIKKLNLVNSPEFGADQSSSTNSGSAAATTEDTKRSASRREMAAIRGLSSRLAVSRVGLTYIIEITYRSLDPDRAAQIANAIADAYITEQLNARYEAARRAAIWLQDRINELHDQVAAAETAVVDYQKKHNLVNTGGPSGPNSRLMGQQRISELNSQLVLLSTATAEAKARFDRITEVLNSGSVNATVTDTLKSDLVSKLRAQYFDLAFRESDWSSRYGKDHLAAVGLRNQMQEIKNAIFEEVKRLAETYRSDLEIARQREADVRKDFSKAIADGQNSDTAEITLRQLESNAQSYKTLYDNFLQRYTESVQKQSFPISEARLISPATPPTGKSSPKTFLILSVSCLLGSVFGLGLGWLRDRADSVFRTTDDVQHFLDLDCLALVPVSSGKSAKRLRRAQTSDSWSSLYQVLENKVGKKNEYAGSSPAGKHEIMHPNHDVTEGALRTIRHDDRPLWTVSKQPLSIFTESVRALKLALDLNGLVRPGNVVGFTSSLPNEGKSTLAGALAQLVSLAGVRCLLVDGDLRNPTLSRQLASNAQAGLLEVLAGKMALEDVVWKDSATNMTFLPMVARSRLTNTSDILASRAVEKLFASLRESYDYIIVDCSPVSPVVDVRATARWIDAYVYVIEWGATKPDLVQYALNNAPELRDKILGAVLNKVDLNILKRYGGKYKDYLSEKYLGRYVREI